MRRALYLLFPLALVACAPASGCTALDPSRSILGQTVLDEKALFAGEAAMFGANTAAEAAVDTGLLKPGSVVAVSVADKLDTAKKALDVARAAYRAGDAKSYGDKLASVQALVAEAWALIPVRGSGR